MLVQIVGLYRAGRVNEAADTFYRAVPLMRFEFQEGIGMAIRKEVLHRRGALASPATRPPAAALDQTTREALDRVMKWVELEADPSAPLGVTLSLSKGESRKLEAGSWKLEA